MIYIQTCRNCGVKFKTSKKNQKFCSVKCRTYFRKKINIIVIPAKPIKIEIPDFGRKTPINHKVIQPYGMLSNSIIKYANKPKKQIEPIKKHKKTIKKTMDID